MWDSKAKVLQIDSSGLHVTGEITATGGKIGPLSIPANTSTLKVSTQSTITTTVYVKLSGSELPAYNVSKTYTGIANIPIKSGNYTKTVIGASGEADDSRYSLTSCTWANNGNISFTLKRITSTGSPPNSVVVSVDLKYKVDSNFFIDSTGKTNIYSAYIEDLQSPIISNILERLKKANI